MNKLMAMRIPEELFNYVKAAATKENRSVSAIIRNLISDKKLKEKTK